MTRTRKTGQRVTKSGATRTSRHSLRRLALACAAIITGIPAAHAACGGIATAFCVSSFSSAETPPGTGSIPNSGFSYLGKGAFSLTLSDPLSGQTGINLQVTDGGEASVTTGGKITGTAGDGIAASSANGPVMVKLGAGGVIATGAGIRAFSGSAGNINVTGAGTIQAGGNGIIATTGGGNVFVNVTGPVTGASGIIATTSGAGGMTVMTSGAITGASGDGISATSQDGLNAIIVGAGGVTGAMQGVNAVASGTGSLSLSIGGSVTGVASNGIAASTLNGAQSITINNGVTVSGATNGLSVNSQTGTATIVNNGIVMAATGRAFTAYTGTGSASLTNNGLLTGSTAVENRAGTLAITNNALMVGNIMSATYAMTTLNNIGTWSNAGGSNIASLTNSGTLSLGVPAGQPAFLTIMGNAVFEANSTLNIRLTTDAADKIFVGGTTQIKGGTLVISMAPGAYMLGQTQQIIQSSGALTGAFSSVFVKTSGYLSSNVVTSANGVSLTMGYGLLAPAALTRNQRAVAEAFDKATRTAPTGNAGKLMEALYSLSGDAPLAVLNQMNADAPGAAANNNLTAGSMFSGTLAARQELMRAPVPAIAPAAAAVSWYTGVPASRYAPEEAGRIGVWATGFGNVGSFSADRQQGSSAQTHNAKGAALGVDYQIGAFSAGIAGGISDGAFKAGSASGTARGVHAGVHAGLALGDIYANASLTGAQYENETSRHTAGLPGIAAETQKGRIAAREIRGRIEAGMYNKEEGFSIAPFVAMEIAALQSGRYTETLGSTGGQGMLSLAYAARMTQSIPVFLGLRLDGNMMLSNGVIMSSKVSVAWKHELSTARSFNAALTIMPDARFTVSGAKADANTLQTKLSLQLQLSRTLAVFASLEGDFSAHHRSITGRSGATLTW